MLYFFLFGSRFVVSPGLGVEFELPRVPGASSEARMTTHVITVRSAGQILVGDGYRTMEQLQEWLSVQAQSEKHPALLVKASASVPAAILARILGLAHAAGFTVTVAAEDDVKPGTQAAPAP